MLRNVVSLAGVVGALALLGLGCISMSSGNGPTFNENAAVTFVFENFGDSEVRFRIRISDSVRNNGNPVSLAPGEQIVLQVENPCPSRVEFFDIQFGDLSVATPLVFAPGLSTRVPLNGQINPNPIVPEPADASGDQSARYVCPASFQVAITEEGEVRAAVLTTVPAGGEPITPTPFTPKPRPIPSFTDG